MRSAAFAAGAWLAVCATGALAQAPAPARSAAAFDPAKPFAGLTAPDPWVKRFKPGEPHLVANDPFGNMTSREFWTGSWQGQNIDHPERTPASIKGGGGTGVAIRSPYPYRSAQEHYEAWRAAAHGGTQHTRANLPDWSGDWQGGADGVLGYNAKVSDVYAAVSDAYKPRFITMLRGEWEGGHQWWPAAFCLPDAFSRVYSGGGVWHFMTDETMAVILEDRPENATRYIYTDGRGFLPENLRFPQWYGASQGFWDGDELVVWTSQIKPWAMTHGLPQYSDQYEVIERIKRFGDQMLVDITLYDPKVFAFPWHDTATFHIVKDWTTTPSTWTECVSTNNVYLNQKGEIAEHAPGEPGYLDVSDPEPWFTAYKLWDANHPDLATHWKAVFDQAATDLKATR
jgi:hypothetical protein